MGFFNSNPDHQLDPFHSIRRRAPSRSNRRPKQISIYEDQNTDPSLSTTSPTTTAHSTTQTDSKFTSSSSSSASSSSSLPSHKIRSHSRILSHSSNHSPAHHHTQPLPLLDNPSFLTIPQSRNSLSRSHGHASKNNNPRSDSSPRKCSYSSSVHDHPSVANSRLTPLPGSRSTSALSKLSFRSLRSINSRIKIRIQSLGQALESHKPPKPELDWSNLRAEYELNLARGSIIERCLVEVDLGPSVTERGRWWIDTVWTLADRLSPPLPAALAQYSAAGLLPLLSPLRQTLHSLAMELPYQHLDDTEDMEKFEKLATILRKAIWLAGLIESVIEIVSQVGLVKFELIGLKKPINDIDDDYYHLEKDSNDEEAVDWFSQISSWSGDIKGRTGSGSAWRGSIKVS